jgi:hypothetical protein
MKQKQTIKLNESQLRNLIKESIKNILSEDWRDTGHEYTNQYVNNEYGSDPHEGPSDEDSQKEIDLLKQMEAEFDNEFGPGSFRKARKIVNTFAKLGLSPNNAFFKRFTSPATQALDSFKFNR